MPRVTGWGDTERPLASRITIVGDRGGDFAGVLSLLHDAGHRVVHYDPLVALIVIGSRATAADRSLSGAIAPGREIVAGDFTLDLLQRTLRFGSRSFPLAPRQFLVMAALMRSPERTLTREELCESAEIRSAKVTARARSLDMQILHLRKHIEADTAHPQHIITVRQVGYRFVPVAPPSIAHYPRRIA